MKRLYLLIFFILIILLISTNSYQKTGLEHYYFVIGLGLDKLENNMLKISVQLSTTKDESSSSSGSSQTSSSEVYSVEARSINEGITILNNYLSKKLNFSHCSAVIFSEDLAKDGIKKYFNTLSNDIELRQSALLLVSSSTSYDFLKNISSSGETFSSRMFEHYTSSVDYTGFSYKSTLGDFFQNLHNDSIDPVCLYVSNISNTMQTSGLAIFKDDKMVGNISVSDSIAHLILTNNLETAIISMDNPFNKNEKIDIEISLYKDTSYDIEILNNTPCIVAKIHPEGRILSADSTFNYSDSDNIRKIEDFCNSHISKLTEEYFINTTKVFNVDTVGYKDLYKSRFLTEEIFEKTSWDSIFKNSRFASITSSKVNSSNLFNKD